MFFKNLRIYSFTESPALTAKLLSNTLENRLFQPCASHDAFTLGFVPVMGKDLVREYSDRYLLFCMKKEERVLPSAAINEELASRVANIEERESRKLPAKERARLKDELIFELLPRSLTKSSKMYAYIDLSRGEIIVDSASASKAEDLLSQLRKCLGSLPVVPIQVKYKPVSVMTEWLADPESFLPVSLTINNECELRSIEEDGAVIRCKNQDLDAPVIQTHIDDGKQVFKIAINWLDRISFTIDQDMAVKKLKFLDIVQSQIAEIEVENEEEAFDADFTIMSAEFSKLISDLNEYFSLDAD